jgi:hypothetical protein
VGRSCSTNGGHEECVLDIGGKVRRKEPSKKNQTYVAGSERDRMEWYGLDSSGSG